MQQPLPLRYRCDRLGFPVAFHKVEGPSPILTFLGIEIDTLQCQLRLPQAKLSTLKLEISRWSRRHRCTKRELQVFIGILNHAASVIGPGRTFLRGLIEALPHASAPHHHTRLNALAKADIIWWESFIGPWNGISSLPKPIPDDYATSDASGSWGCGAYWGAEWLRLQWPQDWLSENIATKEMVPIVIATAIWGKSWQGRHICCQCDNSAVVSAITSGRAKYPPLNRLLHCLFFFTAHFDITISAIHIPGHNNTIADAISCNLTTTRNFIFPQLAKCPTHIPEEVTRLVLGKNLLWSSPTWKALFNACLQAV